MTINIYYGKESSRYFLDLIQIRKTLYYLNNNNCIKEGQIITIENECFISNVFFKRYKKLKNYDKIRYMLNYIYAKNYENVYIQLNDNINEILDILKFSFYLEYIKINIYYKNGIKEYEKNVNYIKLEDE